MKYRIIKKLYARIREDGRRCAKRQHNDGWGNKTHNRLVAAGESIGLVRSVFFEGYESVKK